MLTSSMQRRMKGHEDKCSHIFTQDDLVYMSLGYLTCALSKKKPCILLGYGLVERVLVVIFVWHHEDGCRDSMIGICIEMMESIEIIWFSYKHLKIWVCIRQSRNGEDFDIAQSTYPKMPCHLYDFLFDFLFWPHERDDDVCESSTKIID